MSDRHAVEIEPGAAEAPPPEVAILQRLRDEAWSVAFARPGDRESLSAASAASRRYEAALLSVLARRGAQPRRGRTL